MPHLRGKAPQDHFPSWMPGATQSSSPGRAVLYLTLGTKGFNFHPHDKLITATAGPAQLQGSLQLPEDNPCPEHPGTAWNLLCLMSPAHGVDVKGLCPTPLGSFSSKEKFNEAINTRRTMSITIHSSILLVPHENPSRFKKQTSSLCWFLRTFKAT